MNPTERARMMRSIRRLEQPVATIPLRPDWTELTPKELLADLKRADAPPVLVDAMADWHDAPERWVREPRHTPPHIDAWLIDRYQDRPQTPPQPASERKHITWTGVAWWIAEHAPAAIVICMAFLLALAVYRAGMPA